MTPDEIKAIQSRVDTSARDELANLLQVWFDKHQPEAKRNFASAKGNSPVRDCGNIFGDATDWFYYGN